MLARRWQIPAFSPAVTGSAYYWFYWALVAFYAPFFNVYLTELGLSGLQLGMIAAIAPLMVLTLSPILSAQADRLGKRLQLLRLGLFGWAIILLLYRFPTGFWGILLLVVFESILRSPTASIGDSLIARMASRYNLGYGRMRMWGSLGFAIVSIAGSMLWQRFGYQPMFLIAAVTIIPVLFFTTRLEPGPYVSAQERRPVRELGYDLGLVTIFAGGFLAGMALYSTFVFGGVYLEQLGGNQTQIGLLFGLSALIEVPVMQHSDTIVRRFSGAKVLLFAYGILCLSLIIHGIAWSPVILIVAGIIKGVGYGLFFVVSVSLINSRAPDEWTSTAQAIFGACLMGLAPLLTTVLSGYIFDRWGGDVLFLGMAGVLALSLILLATAVTRGWLDPVPIGEKE